MKVSTVNYSGKISDVRLSGCTVIVIDVLRSSTCIIWALRNGATKVIPAVDPGDAWLLAETPFWPESAVALK